MLYTCTCTSMIRQYVICSNVKKSAFAYDFQQSKCLQNLRQGFLTSSLIDLSRKCVFNLRVLFPSFLFPFPSPDGNTFMCSSSPMLLSGFGIVLWWMDACPYSHARYICSCFLLHGLSLYAFILTHLDFVPVYVLKNGSNCASLKWLFTFSYTIYKMPG